LDVRIPMVMVTCLITVSEKVVLTDWLTNSVRGQYRKDFMSCINVIPLRA
jgi:hypothetical protein